MPKLDLVEAARIIAQAIAESPKPAAHATAAGSAAPVPHLDGRHTCNAQVLADRVPPLPVRLDSIQFIMHNEYMPLIQVRDVPEDVRDELARKAALAGKSLQSYLLGELTKLSERPSMAEIVERAQARAKATGSTVTMSDAVAAVRAGRDRHAT